MHYSSGMNIWALADLHLALGVPAKTMEIFGSQWHDYQKKIAQEWQATVKPADLVLIAGDISWAMRLEEAKVDLAWIDRLPGQKILIRGNHDYWWSSLAKVQSILPPSIHLIQNSAYTCGEVSIGGARLWDTDEYHFQSCMNVEVPLVDGVKEKREQEKIFKRELERLELSLKALPAKASVKIAMTHYPPIGLDLKPSQASALLEKYGVQQCVFGHLHNVKRGAPLFGKRGGVTYHLTSSDYLDFKPLLIHSSYS